MKSRVLTPFMLWVVRVAVILSFGTSSADTKVGIMLSQEAVSHARAVQAEHEDKLMSLRGVQGVGIGARDGRATILILVDQQSREVEIPVTVGDMPVIVEEVGRIVAHQTVNLGNSVGNDILCTGPCDSNTCNFCDVGTIGFKVCDKTTPTLIGFVTNNHVAASGCPGKCPNNAPVGTSLFHPGLVDNTPVCTTTGATNVGTLNRFVTLVLDGSTPNDVDAAFVQSTDALVSSTIQGLGLQNNTTAIVSVGDAVCKSGRTSGVTCGTITGINLTINVNYEQVGDPTSPGTCGTGTGRFRNIVRYEPTAPSTIMTQGGDSGSPVVLNDGTLRAVAINFAGNTSGTQGFGILIGAVLTELNVSLYSDIPEVVSAPSNPSGPVAGSIGVTYTYSTGGSTSNLGHPIQYRFNWGDGTYSDWSSSASASKSWSTPNTYSVKPQARCSVDTSVMSDWSPGLSVTISTIGPDLAGSWTIPVTQTCRTIGKNEWCRLKGIFTVINLGNRDASSTYVKFYLSDNNTYEEGDMLLKSFSKGKLKPGKSKKINVSYNLPRGQSASGKYIIGFIDQSNVIGDVNVGNNVISYGPIP